MAAGQISADDQAEITALVGLNNFDNWRPVLYVIARAPVAARLQPVAPAQRAGAGPEFIIPDLAAAEFQTVEF